MELHDYIRILRRSWLLVVSLPLVGLLVALGYSLLQVPQYEATSAVFVSTQQASTVQDLNQGGTFVQQVVKSYADIAKRPAVLDPVIENLRLNLTADQLAGKVDASTPTDTSVLQISVTDASPRMAAEIANAISTRLSSVVAELSPTTTGESSPVKISSVQAAEAPASPVSPRIPLDAAIGLLAGLLIAFIVSVIRERIDTRIRSVRDVELVTDRPILGGIAFDASAAERPLIVQADPHSARAESFRSLRTNLQFLDFDGQSQVTVVTSSVESEGKSTSAANLAIAVADTGLNVLLVDGDLRRPKLAEYLGLEGEVGLTDVLIGRATLEEAIQSWGTSSLKLLPAGQVPPNPSELLQSQSLLEVISTLRAQYDMVLFDAPPLLPVTDAAILAKRTDGAIVVCAVGRANRHQLASSLGALDQVDARVLGLVVTMVPNSGPDAYGYGRYGYGRYGYGALRTTEGA